MSASASAASSSESASTPDPVRLLDARFRAAISSVLGIVPEACDPQIRASSDPKHGDFQSNAAIALAKAHGQKPRELA